MTPLLLLFVLAIPVAIHVFNRSEGKVVLFPYVALLPKQSAPTELQIKLYQKRLLLVRLLLFLCATLILLSPLLAEYLKQNSLAQSDRNNTLPSAIIITQDWWLVSTVEQKQALLASVKNDAALATIPTIVLVSFVPFEIIRPVKVDEFISNGARYPWFTISPESTLDAFGLAPQNTWAIAQAIASSLPQNTHIHIYTSNRQSQFYGKPVLTTTASQTVHWNIADIATMDAPSNSQIDKTDPKIGSISVALLAQHEGAEKALLNSMIAAAIDALRLIIPIDFTIIKPSEFSPELAASSFDAILLYSHELAQAETLAYISLPNTIDMSGLPNPNELKFVLALGETLLHAQELKNMLRYNTLSQAQIENSAANTHASTSYENGVATINSVESAAPSSALWALHMSQANKWIIWLISFSILLFFIERIYSEWVHRIIFHQSSATDSKAA